MLANTQPGCGAPCNAKDQGGGTGLKGVCGQRGHSTFQEPQHRTPQGLLGMLLQASAPQLGKRRKGKESKARQGEVPRKVHPTASPSLSHLGETRARPGPAPSRPPSAGTGRPGGPSPPA